MFDFEPAEGIRAWFAIHIGTRCQTPRGRPVILVLHVPDKEYPSSNQMARYASGNDSQRQSSFHHPEAKNTRVSSTTHIRHHLRGRGLDDYKSSHQIVSPSRM